MKMIVTRQAIDPRKELAYCFIPGTALYKEVDTVEERYQAELLKVKELALKSATQPQLERVNKALSLGWTIFAVVDDVVGLSYKNKNMVIAADGTYLK